MSVLIRGMDEMPEDGAVLMVKRDDDGKTYIKYAGMMGYHMELVILPEKHGRLIDADALLKIYSNRYEKLSERYGFDSSELGILCGASKLLDVQPTVIDTEGEE